MFETFNLTQWYLTELQNVCVGTSVVRVNFETRLLAVIFFNTIPDRELSRFGNSNTLVDKMAY